LSVPAAPALTALLGCSLVGLVVYASLHPERGIFGPTVVRGPAASAAVALTFDDGPDPEHTPRVLDALAAGGARATFFLIGRRVLEQPSLARTIVERGHQVALHGHSHRWELMFFRRRLLQDLADSAAAVVAATGLRPRFYRPPVGIVAPEVHDAAEAVGARLVAWSLRPFDGAGLPPDDVHRRVSSKIRGGDIVLLHDARPMGASHMVPPAVAALPAILDDLARRGLRSVTLAELLGQDAYVSESTAVSTSAPLNARWSRLPLAVLATLILLGVLFARQAFAAGAESGAGTEALPPALLDAAGKLAAHQTVRARFTQTKTSALFTEDVVRRGTLELRRSDGRLVWSYDGGPSVLMAGGRFYPAGVDSQQAGREGKDGWAMPGGGGLPELMSGMFGLDSAVLSRHFRARDLGAGRFELSPRGPQTAALFAKVVLEVSGEPLALRGVRMDEATGDRSVVAFEQVELDVAIPDDRFLTPVERSAGKR
jgi:peptidoglycan/xylan/chitin deacetylase (PgdA/CDA1 family)/outer membrane lipoprotein-sorting protein